MQALISRGPVITLDQRELIDSRNRAENRRLHALGRRRHHAAAPVLVEEGPVFSDEVFIQRGNILRGYYLSISPEFP